MPTRPYRALRIILGVLSLLVAAGGLVLIFGGKPLMARMPFAPPESEVSTLLLATIKEMGGILLMLGVLFLFASRDPVRNVAIIDGLIVGLIVLAVTSLISLYTLDLRRLYPAYLIWGRSAVRLALAGVLYLLRPREGARVAAS